MSLEAGIDRETTPGCMMAAAAEDFSLAVAWPIGYLVCVDGKPATGAGR